MRFEALCTPDTKVLYLTDGMLFREILLDPLLSRSAGGTSRTSLMTDQTDTLAFKSRRYSVVMVDEAHERSFYTDLLLGVLKKCVGPSHSSLPCIRRTE